MFIFHHYYYMPFYIEDATKCKHTATGEDYIPTRTANNEFCNKIKQTTRCPKNQEYFDACTFDVGAQPNNEQAHCQAVEAFLNECDNKELLHGWRRNAKCRKFLLDNIQYIHTNV